MSRAVLLMIAAALVAPGVVFAEPWPLAVRLMNYGDYQDAAWDHMREMGIKHVFMSIPGADEAKGVIAKLEDYGFSTPVLRGQADLSKDTFADELEPQLMVAREMGADFVFLSAKHGESTLEDAYRRLREAGDVAKRYDIVLTVETHPELGTNGDLQVQTMKGVDHPNVRINFDTGNITYYNENTNPETELEKSAQYVATVEFKDHNGALEVWDFPVLGQGKVDFEAVVRLLRQNNYSGPVTIEFEGTHGVELDRAQTLQAIADSVAFARTLAEFD